jgi:hypothetical protein
MARILDGKAAAAEVRAEVAEGVKELRSRGRAVRLDVILVGEDPASVTYVRNKQTDCAEVGMETQAHRFPRTPPRRRSRRSSSDSTRTRPSLGSLYSFRCRTTWTRGPCSPGYACTRTWMV